jgi:maltose/moltooligosaccharide transporter
MWNLSFGFFGVQIAYALQSANISRIFATLGADPHTLSFFWLLPPLMGMIVQPIVGAMSDKTWCKWGRRKPYLYVGAIVAIIVMALLPNSGSFDMTVKAALAFGALMLMLLDTSINMAMQPFKMMVGDMVNEEQKTQAYSIQSLLCNAGSLVGYLLPFCLTWVGVKNIAPEGQIPESVTWSFYIGAIILILCVLYTGAKVKEWNPEDYAKYNNIKKEDKAEKTNLFKLLIHAPKIFWQIGLVQFFCWFAFLFMWTYTTGGIAENVTVWNTIDTSSPDYQAAGDWTGVLFAVQAVGSILWAMVLPRFKSVKMGYSVSLVLGAIGFISTAFIHDQYTLAVSFLLIGCAWAAMLALPFALLTNALTGKSLGSYMGLFTCTICLPQIVASLVGIAIMALVGKEYFVNELDYPKSPNVENCALVTVADDATEVAYDMTYNEELECYTIDNLPTTAVAENFFVVANGGEEQYAINKDATKSEMAPNEAFSLKRRTDKVDIKGLKVVKRNEDNAVLEMKEMVDVYFYAGCDRLFVMEDGETFDEAKLMPKATSGQINMLVVAGVALLIGAFAVFGISTRRKE